MEPCQAFVVQRRAELRRIACQTCGEHTGGDVEVETWLIADRIATIRSRCWPGYTTASLNMRTSSFGMP